MALVVAVRFRGFWVRYSSISLSIIGDFRLFTALMRSV